ncbi:MAG: type I DNA topoisomerase [bacterium]|nr:type I DNA topoisomerase [bacterium]
MPRPLIIVESPAKAKTIQKLLRGKVKVEASMGHVRDLPRSQLGVDEGDGFAPKYVTIRGKGETLKRLREQARKAGGVYLATDPDREGEAISWHLAQALGLDEDDPIRIEFHEVTREALQRALKNPRPIDDQLVEAQQARRILDRLVGYKLSPLLWRKVRRGLSAGRVQSAALRMICDREEAIRAFRPEHYWTVTAWLEDGLLARYWGSEGRRLALRRQEEVDRLLADLQGVDFEIQEIRKSRRQRRAPAAFTTSTLQQDAYRRLGFPVRKTMRVAQQLYEGLDLGDEGTVGLITYIRTDSARVAASAREQAVAYLERRFGARWVGEPAPVRQRPGTQGAHEAIRPTRVDRDPDAMTGLLNAEQAKLYRLIWDRFVASQMAPTETELTVVQLAAGQHVFRASGSVVVFEGFAAVYGPEARGVAEEGSRPEALAGAQGGRRLRAEQIKEQKHTTQPPPRYTEASLVKALEENGIGRPSTYAPIIETVLQRGYVVREERSLAPTDVGFRVVALLKEYFPDIVDPGFTAGLESQLDAVEEGRQGWQELLGEFYVPFRSTLERAEQEIGGMEIPDEVTDVPCERCGRPLVVKYSRYGRFLGCPGFPECRTTKPYLEAVGVRCPRCGKDMVVRRSRKGRRFYGCSGYPECDFVTWQRPVDRECAECGAFLVEMRNRAAGLYYACSREGCDYREFTPGEQEQ